MRPFNSKKQHQGKPKVVLPKAREVNETVSLDLKAVSSITGNKADQRQIVYCVDEFSKWTAAVVSKNKEAESVIKVVLTEWCLKGLGYPSRSFFADYGNEFEKSTLEDVAKKLGVKWSNGGNKRKHGTIDQTLKKLLDEDS